MDMDVAVQKFVEESEELLTSAEDTLLRLEDDPRDSELINELFRTVHTLKGSSGLFGFDNVVSFTHTAESVMGLVREGTLVIDADLLTLLLESRDHIATLVAQALGDTELSQDDQNKGQDLLTKLSNYLAEDPSDADVPDTSSASNSQTSAAEQTALGSQGPSEGSVQSDCWHISLRFGENALRNGLDPMSFINYLATVGDIENLVTVVDSVPSAQSMDPESCYMGFELDLRSGADKATIEAVFEFAQDDCDIRILPPFSHLADFFELIENAPEENLRVGELLVLCGALTQHELDTALRSQQESAAETSDEAAPLIGELVVEKSAVEPKVVDAALEKQKKTKESRAMAERLVRVHAGRLDHLINLVSELVIAGANTVAIGRDTDDPALHESTENMIRLIEEVRDTSLGLRMVQIGETFNGFRRIVRELSKEMGKDIELQINGGETELDKSVVEKIGDPLMHLVRNSIDHGVEAPSVRQQNGKSEKATLSLNARHDFGSIVIEVCDDGAGLNRDKILAKAIERELVKPTAALGDREVYQLIFEPGFSTADQVTNISGRGVGMDVVRRNVDALRGQVEVESTPGVGTTFSIRLPLTLAIIDGFQVRVGRTTYVLPLDQVVQCIELDDSNFSAESGGNYVNLRGEVLPFIRLREVFGEFNGHGSNRDNIVVVQYGEQRAGLVVDELLGEYQTVIKPLGKIFQNLKGISGATILGSGEVAMILDAAGLVQRIDEMHIPTQYHSFESASPVQH